MATKKYFLSFHTIFILSENILWLEEFLIYYKHIGFDHFYLYDNEGSTGGDGTTTHNKYGIYAPTQSTQEQQDMFARIMEKYSSIITYVKWQPRDANGNITYGQVEGVRHFIYTYGHETEWVALMDLDEFLYSPADINIRQYFNDLPSTVSNIVISQEKFVDRHDISGSYATQDFRCVHGISIGFGIGPKNVLRTDDFISTSNIHYYKVKHKTIQVEKRTLRFNHYNGNTKQLKELSALFQIDLTLNSVDNGMSRYANLFGLTNNIESQLICKRKLVYIGTFDSPLCKYIKDIAKLLKNDYDIMYYNIYHFYMNAFVDDLRTADICIMSEEGYLIMDWTTFPKSHTILSKIIILFDSEPKKHILENLNPNVKHAVTVSNLQQFLPIKTYILSFGFDIAPFTHITKDGELNVIGWQGTDPKNWAYMIANNAHLPMSMAPSTLPFERKKNWFKTIDVLLHTADSDISNIYEAVASGVPVIAVYIHSSLPGPTFTTQAEAVAILNDLRLKPTMLKELAVTQYDYLKTNIAFTSLQSRWSNVLEEVMKRPSPSIIINKYLFNNLAHRIDRKDHMLKQFAAADISSESIVRIDACYRPEFGHLGCSESHIKALQTALDNKWEWTAIFEDDFTFHRPATFHQEIQEALKLMEPDVLLLAQGTLGLIYEDTTQPNIIRIKRSVTASGYIIHRNYVPVLLKNFQTSRNNLEAGGTQATWYCIDQAWAPLQANDRWFGFKQPVGYQIDGHSDIVGSYVRYNC